MNIMAKDERQQPTRSTVIGKVIVPLLFPLREFLTCCPELQNCLSLNKILSKELHILSWEGQKGVNKNTRAAIAFFWEKAKQPSRLSSCPG